MLSTLRGIPAASGIAIGSCLLYDPTPPVIPQHQITLEAVPAERERLQHAIAASVEEVGKLRDQVQERLGKEAAAIFNAHLLMLEDEALLEGAYLRLEQELMNAERAIWESAEEFAQIIAELSDSYFRARAADMHDIRVRIVCHLQERSTPHLHHITPAIIVARDLLPSDTAGLDPAFVLGLATEQGGPTSHTAILARQLGIPAVVGVSGLLAALESMSKIPARLAIDGSAGTVELDPDPATISRYETTLHSYRQRQQELQAFRNRPAITLDHVRVEIAANIGRPQDASPAVVAGADGVGLFRTEFLFLERTTPPDEEEQLAAYRTVLQAFAGKTVIIRTLDIGGDKSIPYLELAPESNPFLGLRGIRLCLAKQHQYLFRTQLRALLRAAEQNVASLWIMLPMISDIRELRQTKAIIADTEATLLEEGGIRAAVRQHLRLGVMVETPAAALLVDVLAKEADFFSIGTNDLVQYTLASDRMNASLADLHSSFHPAVMRSIAHIVTTAHKHERWVGMCGEMAGDPHATAFLVGLGINELSMELNSFNAVKQVVCNTTTSQAQVRVERVLQAESAEAVEALLRPE
ncbi:MAG: phosphoenolpyruvate--protein phosphotransferase [Chloroflexota bacterium]|nr:phosphoenolpyruvate--protein phosphotransferase [Chloroflexota bacterium]